MLPAGTFVKIHGLQSDQARRHNGCTGVITAPRNRATGRYGVKPHGLHKNLAIKPANVTSLTFAEALAAVVNRLDTRNDEADRQRLERECRVQLLVEELEHKFGDTCLFREDEHMEIIGDQFLDLSPAEFLRPDGDVEGKNVQWCLDNDFVHIREGLWAGEWYYRDHGNPDDPAEEKDRERHARETRKIRALNDKRREYVRAKAEAEAEATAKAKKREEEEFAKVLMGDIARQTGRSIDDPDFFVSPLSGQRMSKDEEAHMRNLAATGPR